MREKKKYTGKVNKNSVGNFKFDSKLIQVTLLEKINIRKPIELGLYMKNGENLINHLVDCGIESITYAIASIISKAISTAQCA